MEDRLTVVIDLRPLIGPAFGPLAGVKTGIGEFTDHVVRALITDGRFRLILFSNSLRQLASRFNGKFVTTLHTHIPNRVLDLAVRGFNAPKLDAFVACKTGIRVDVWLSPHITSAPLKRARKIVIVHDCSFLYPEFFSWRKRYWHWSMGIARTLKAADRIITVSEHTRRELLRRSRLPVENVSAVYPGVDGRFFHAAGNEESAAVRRTYRLPGRFILFLGTLEPRKNILTLLQAFERVAREDKDVQLVLAGMPGWRTRPMIRALTLHSCSLRIRCLGFVADEDKNALYRLSSCFVYPSLYEGFGFPPLEAMACGVPVVVSHVTSLPEVVGTRALAVDPYNAEELARAIGCAITDKPYRDWCAQEGPQRAAQFKWERTAERIAEVIEAAGRGDERM